MTICVQNRECLFGDVVDGKMVLNDYGRIVKEKWGNTPKLRTNVELDEFIVMPNHFRGIVVIAESGRDVLQYASTTNGQPPQSDISGFRSPSQTIGAIIRGFKCTATKQINEWRNTPGARIWQRNYYEHIIRNDDEFDRIREYIAVNPTQWELDRENLNAPGVGRGVACRAPEMLREGEK